MRAGACPFNTRVLPVSYSSGQALNRSEGSKRGASFQEGGPELVIATAAAAATSPSRISLHGKQGDWLLQYRGDLQAIAAAKQWLAAHTLPGSYDMVVGVWVEKHVEAH